MPVVTVNLWEEKLDGDCESRLIESVTRAITDVLGPELREHTTVLLVGVPRERWGTGGIPASRLDTGQSE